MGVSGTETLVDLVTTKEVMVLTALKNCLYLEARDWKRCRNSTDSNILIKQTTNSTFDVFYILGNVKRIRPLQIL